MKAAMKRTTLLGSCLLLLGVLVLACGGGSEPGGDGDGDGAGGGDGSNPLSPTPEELNLMPLAVGNTWSYQITTGGTCLQAVDGIFTQTMAEPRESIGKLAFPLEPALCEGTVDYFVIEDGVLLEQEGVWGAALDAPVQDGHAWMYPSGEDYVYEAVSSITVPAGTFTNCWRRVLTGPEDETKVFCPDVGMVREESFVFLAELESYSLVQ